VKPSVAPLPVLTPIAHGGWACGPSPAVAAAAARELERGNVLFLPELPFPIDPGESAVFSPAILGSAKNASFDPASGRVGGTTLSGAELDRLCALLARFSDAAAGLVDQLLPRYRGSIARARASFRPAEIAGRSGSWRKDDTRLHVDSFPSSPVQGRRILRLFCNVNPDGRPRTWRIGEAFEPLATRFADRLSFPLPGTSALLKALRITKARRSAYDALMLQLHDRMKADVEYQSCAPQSRVEFPAGTTWMAFTDQVSHAAMAGQHQLEQTFLLPIEAMADPAASPLRVLERITGRRLA
jgi:hypothetical protein